MLLFPLLFFVPKVNNKGRSETMIPLPVDVATVATVSGAPFL